MQHILDPIFQNQMRIHYVRWFHLTKWLEPMVCGKCSLQQSVCIDLCRCSGGNHCNVRYVDKQWVASKFYWLHQQNSTDQIDVFGLCDLASSLLWKCSQWQSHLTQTHAVNRSDGISPLTYAKSAQHPTYNLNLKPLTFPETTVLRSN